MATGPAKKGHNCNQVWRDQGSGTCCPTRLEASTQPQLPDCWQQLMATDTSEHGSVAWARGKDIHEGIWAFACTHLLGLF